MLVTEMFEAEKQWLPHVLDGEEKNVILLFLVVWRRRLNYYRKRK
jgi:hypothetical protein